MTIENKTPKEIQAEIYFEIGRGVNREQLKAELKDQGLLTEAYYFTTEKEQLVSIEELKTPSSAMSTKQILWAILVLVILVFRIARCSSRM
jgi:hypothetical protein